MEALQARGETVGALGVRLFQRIVLGVRVAVGVRDQRELAAQLGHQGAVTVRDTHPELRTRPHPLLGEGLPAPHRRRQRHDLMHLAAVRLSPFADNLWEAIIARGKRTSVESEPSVTGKAVEGFGKAMKGLGKVARDASSQVAETAGTLKDATKEHVESLTAKKADTQESTLEEQAPAENLARTVKGIGKVARGASSQIAETAESLKDATKEKAESLTAKKSDPYEEAVAEYNAVYTQMNDKGVTLLLLRERSADLIGHIELLVNSIANTPKSFATDFAQIDQHRAQFQAAEEFARKDLEAARASALGAGAGFTAGAAVASMAPTAALWAATTFGTASTGTAISTLSGAAATNAALAWIGGGALAAGGGGTAAGTALLAMAGPIGWTVAGATLLASVAIYAHKTFESREAKHEALLAVKRNIALVAATDVEIDELAERTASLREHLTESYGAALSLYGKDFLGFSASERSRIVALVNNTLASAALLSTRIEQGGDDGDS